MLRARAATQRVVDDGGRIGARRSARRPARRRARPTPGAARRAAARNVSAAASSTEWPVGLEPMRELADGRRLAGAVHAEREDHERLVRRRSSSGASTRLHQAERRLPQQLDGRRAGDCASIAAAHLVDQPRRSRRRRRRPSSSRVSSSSIGRFVERPLTEPEQIRRQPRRAAVEARFELREEARALFPLRFHDAIRTNVSGEMRSGSVAHMAKRGNARRAPHGSVRIIAGEWRGRRIADRRGHCGAADAGSRARDRVQLAARRSSRARAVSISMRAPARSGSKRCRAARQEAWFVEQDPALVAARSSRRRKRSTCGRASFARTRRRLLRGRRAAAFRRRVSRSAVRVCPSSRCSRCCRRGSATAALVYVERPRRPGLPTVAGRDRGCKRSHAGAVEYAAVAVRAAV